MWAHFVCLHEGEEFWLYNPPPQVFCSLGHKPVLVETSIEHPQTIEFARTMVEGIDAFASEFIVGTLAALGGLLARELVKKER